MTWQLFLARRSALIDFLGSFADLNLTIYRGLTQKGARKIHRREATCLSRRRSGCIHWLICSAFLSIYDDGFIVN